MPMRPFVVAGLAALAALPLGAQWSNRYPRLAGFNHHVYLEGYELPTLTQGPMDPAPAPDGKRIAFASRGWLWLFDPATGVATRLTRGGQVDARPAWSPDGTRLAFVRDDGRSLAIMLVDVATRAETRLVADSAIVLDPAFSPDGRTLYYSSGAGGDLDLWKVDLATRATTRITTTNGLNELQPMPTRDGTVLVYLAKTRGGADQVRRRVLSTGEDAPLASGSILSMMRGAVHPDGRSMVLAWPSQEGYELRLASATQPGATVELLREPRLLPLAPAFSADGNTIWFAHADARQAMHLARVPTAGGAWQDVEVKRWDWGAPTAQLRVMTKLASGGVPVPARIAVAGGDLHPMVPDVGQVRFDGQNGVAFFYSDGVATLTVPAGEVTVTAVRGLATPPVTERVTLKPGETRTVTLSLAPVWNARAAGWLSGEHHFHLNYGGPYVLAPDALVDMGLAEDLDVLTPMLANLAQRFEDQPLFAWRHVKAKPWIVWAQEVRAHFFGHVGMLNTSALFWPWIWGPGYDVHQRDDRPNADALAWARTHGGLNTYVHPVSDEGPFAAGAPRGIPVGFVADAVQGQVDALEISCLWSDERGTTDLWYRVLNAGIPIAITAGTDVMNNLYRTMTIGTTRVYVHPDKPGDVASYFAALKAGRSFVSTGPMLDFHVGKAGPGQVVARGAGTAAWTLDLHSAVTVDTLAIIVNGVVVQRLEGLGAPGSRHYEGTVTLPAGGWVAVRATGAPTRAWPGMDSYAFAHTAPVWIDRVGSTEPAAKAQAARDLLRALDVADQALATAYADAEHPRLLAHFAAARRILDGWAKP
ncbi:MAG: CehA/McbA family metallohydrolase [Gemmatimonadetes bacterium]|nr:CehA/McbA family metallohydrolase [Gemmatimonadota bacterium]